MKDKVSPQDLTIVQLVLDSGERLPCLVEGAAWLPVKLATRWAVRHRRYQVQASTLRSDLYSLKKLYQWAWSVAGFDLDRHLLNDQRLTARQIESYTIYIREGNRSLPPLEINNSLS